MGKLHDAIKPAHAAFIAERKNDKLFCVSLQSLIKKLPLSPPHFPNDWWALFS